MAKRVWTDEERKAFGEKMKQKREAKQTMLQNTEKGAPIQPAPPVVPAIEEPQPAPKPAPVVLDLTDKTLDSEAQLTQYILWEFDEGRNPTEIKITSHQANNIAGFTRVRPVRAYQSAFGNHYFKIVSAKERQNEQEA